MAEDDEKEKETKYKNQDKTKIIKLGSEFVMRGEPKAEKYVENQGQNRGHKPEFTFGFHS